MQNWSRTTTEPSQVSTSPDTSRCQVRHLLPEVLLWWDRMRQLAGMNYHPAAADGSKTSTVLLPDNLLMPISCLGSAQDVPFFYRENSTRGAPPPPADPGPLPPLSEAMAKSCHTLITSINF